MFSIPAVLLPRSAFALMSVLRQVGCLKQRSLLRLPDHACALLQRAIITPPRCAAALRIVVSASGRLRTTAFAFKQIQAKRKESISSHVRLRQRDRREKDI